MPKKPTAPAWKDKTPEQRKASADAVKRWRARHLDESRKRDQLYKALRRHPGYQPMAKAVLEHYGYHCLLCPTPFKVPTGSGVVWDHVVPLTAETPKELNDWPNLQPLCRKCNTQKQLITVDYRPDQGAFVRAHLEAHPELSTQSLELYKRPTVTRIAGSSGRLSP